MSTKKFILTEQDIPTAWYNIVADMKNKPLPMMDPKTRKPVTEESLQQIFAKELVKQEYNQALNFLNILFTR